MFVENRIFLYNAYFKEQCYFLQEAVKIRDDEHKGEKQGHKLDGSKVIFCSLISTIVKKANTGTKINCWT